MFSPKALPIIFMPNLGITPEQFRLILLVFFRVGGILIFAPFFNYKTIPVQLKIALTLIISVIVFPIVSGMSTDTGSSLLLNPWFKPQVSSLDIFVIALSVLRELAIGMVLGFASQMVFAGVKLAGEIISVQMGFSMANVFDPQSGQQNTIIAELNNFLALLIFLSLNGHHWFLSATTQSFLSVPLSGIKYSAPLAQQIFLLFGDIFVISLKISAPILTVLLISNVVLGIIGRVVPQFNILMMSFPIKITVGLFMLWGSTGTIAYVLKHLFSQLEHDIGMLISNM